MQDLTGAWCAIGRRPMGQRQASEPPTTDSRYALDTHSVWTWWAIACSRCAPSCVYVKKT